MNKTLALVSFATIACGLALPAQAQMPPNFAAEVTKCINKAAPRQAEVRDVLARCEREALAAGKTNPATPGAAPATAGMPTDNAQPPTPAAKANTAKAQWMNCLANKTAQLDDGISPVGDIATALQNEYVREHGVYAAAVSPLPELASEASRPRADVTRELVTKFALMLRAAKRKNPQQPPR